MTKCPIQDLCIHFDSGSNKPPNHDVRDKFPCIKSIQSACEHEVYVRVNIMGQEVACDIDKMRRIREKK